MPIDLNQFALGKNGSAIITYIQNITKTTKVENSNTGNVDKNV